MVQRLRITPTLFLLVAWAALAAILHFSGVSGRVLQLASRAALIPTWFLAIYIMIVTLAPATYIAWQRWGFASLWAFAILGALGDLGQHPASRFGKTAQSVVANAMQEMRKTPRHGTTTYWHQIDALRIEENRSSE